MKNYPVGKELTTLFNGLRVVEHRGSTAEYMNVEIPGLVAQLVTCLAADTCLTADPGVAGLIPVQSHTFVEIDH